MTDTVKVIFVSGDGSETKEVNWQVEDYATSVATGKHAEYVREATPMVEQEIGRGARVISTLVNDVEQP